MHGSRGRAGGPRRDCSRSGPGQDLEDDSFLKAPAPSRTSRLRDPGLGRYGYNPGEALQPVPASRALNRLPSLPIDEALPALLTALREGPSAVLVAPTGAGKTTRVP